MSFSSSSFYLTNTQYSVSRQVHPLPLEGLGEARPQGLVSHPYPTVPSHIPSSGGAWGGRFFWVRASLFLSISFPFVFQSTPFCVLKDALLQCKRASFDV